MLANSELAGDLFTGKAVGDQPENFQLPGSELLGQLAAFGRAEATRDRGQVRVKDHQAAGRRQHGQNQRLRVGRPGQDSPGPRPPGRRGPFPPAHQDNNRQPAGRQLEQGVEVGFRPRPQVPKDHPGLFGGDGGIFRVGPGHHGHLRPALEPGGQGIPDQGVGGHDDDLDGQVHNGIHG